MAWICVEVLIFKFYDLLGVLGARGSLDRHVGTAVAQLLDHNIGLPNFQITASNCKGRLELETRARSRGREEARSTRQRKSETSYEESD